MLRFGVFEFDSRTGELRKHGARIKLQGKPLQVLQALLARPGEIVSREALRARLWPSDVFVDFEAGLNTAANRLRIVLGDSAENPRYVETLPRVGYRFIAHVASAVSAEGTLEASPPRAAEKRHWLRALPALAALSALAILVVVAWIALRPARAETFEFRQVTFRHGQVWDARFAPDGKSILYTASWDNGPRRLFSTYPSSPESRPLGLQDLRTVTFNYRRALSELFVATPISR